MNNIHPNHIQEWLNSGVAPEIIQDNVKSLFVSYNPYDDSEEDPYEALLYGLPDSERRNDGRLRDSWLRKYQHLEQGGWWCGSINLLSPNCSEISEWGCFKPNQPRISIDGKVIKYEHPPHIETELFALQVNPTRWAEISQRFNVPIGIYANFWHWVIDRPHIPVLITEGAKKAGVLLTSNYVVIALPGIWNGIRQPKNEYGEKTGDRYLIPQLEILATPGREFVLTFDNDTKPKTVENVNKAINATGELLVRKGCSVSVITWDYPQKGVDDLIVQQGVEVFHQLYNSRSTLKQWNGNLEEKRLSEYKEKAWKGWRSFKQFSSQIQIQKKFFEHPCTESGTISFIKSPIGTGKTTWLCKILEQLRQEEYGGISLGYRNTLLLQFCAKSGFYHLHEHSVLSSKLLFDSGARIAACVDSLLHFQPETFKGKILILDEVVSLIKHLLFSRTIPISKLVPILERFAEAVNLADRIICLDGLMTDWVVNYFKRICPDKSVLTIENTHKANKAKIYLLQGTINPKNLKKRKNDKRLFYLKLLNDSPIPAVCSDSQIFLEALDELFISQGRKGLRVDSKTVPEPWVKEFLASPTEYISQHQPEYLLYSPSAESGLDVPITNYFSEHFGFFFGCIDVDSIIQMIGRIRDVNVAKYLWVREKAIATDYEGTRSPIAATVEWAKNQCLTRDIHWSLEEIPSSVQIVSALTNLIDSCKDTHWHSCIEIEAIWNHERANLRECVLEMLTCGGHEVQLVEALVDDLLKQQLIEVNELLVEKKEVVVTQNSKDIFNSSDEYVGKSHSIQMKFDARWEERCKVIKAKLIDKLPGINSSEQWSEEFVKYFLYKQPKLINQLELWWLVNNPEIARQLSVEKYHHLLSKGLEGERLAPWRLRNQYSVVKALMKTGIIALIEHPDLQDRTYRADDPIIQEIVAKGKQKFIKQTLGRAPGFDPIKYVGFLLGLVGVKWKSHQVRGSDGQRYRFYLIDRQLINNPYRQIINECIQRKYQSRSVEAINWELLPPEKIASLAALQTQIGQRIEGVTDDPSKCINTKEVSVTTPPIGISKEILTAVALDFEELVIEDNFDGFNELLKAYKTVMNRHQLNQATRYLSTRTQIIIKKWVELLNQKA